MLALQVQRKITAFKILAKKSLLLNALSMNNKMMAAHLELILRARILL